MRVCLKSVVDLEVALSLLSCSPVMGDPVILASLLIAITVSLTSLLEGTRWSSRLLAKYALKLSNFVALLSVLAMAAQPNYWRGQV